MMEAQEFSQAEMATIHLGHLNLIQLSLSVAFAPGELATHPLSTLAFAGCCQGGRHVPQIREQHPGADARGASPSTGGMEIHCSSVRLPGFGWAFTRGSTLTQYCSPHNKGGRSNSRLGPSCTNYGEHSKVRQVWPVACSLPGLLLLLGEERMA